MAQSENKLGRFATLAFTTALIAEACSSSSATGTPGATKTPDGKPSMPVPTLGTSSMPSMEANGSIQPSLTNPASKDALGNWIVKNPDGKVETVSGVSGFTPDAALVLAPEYGKALPIEPAKFADFQKSLNDPKHPLVGYT